jgi:hypothetical protein
MKKFIIILLFVPILGFSQTIKTGHGISMQFLKGKLYNPK